MPSPARDPLLGRTIAQRYRLISRLGEGSVASVYLARHVLIERLLAIKIARPELGQDPLWRERFLREGRAVNRINHPNIVEITDVGEADGFVFLVMEYVPGESLKQIVERGPIGWRRAAGIGLMVASALGRAHEMGVVHRDLKPENVLVVPRRGGGDVAKLTDFGVAKLMDAAPLTIRAGAEALYAPSGERAAAYFAPEQRELGQADARADLYALGVVLYEATTGELPTSERSAVANVSDKSASRLVGAPAFFDDVLATLLAKEPEDRPRDGYEAADLLRRALERDAALSAIGPLSEPPSGGRFSQRPPSGDVPDSGAPSRPGVEGAPLDRLAPLCDGALDAIEEHVAIAEAEGRTLSPAAREALDETRKLCATVRAVSELVASDTRARESVLARGRAALLELGKRFDEAARERSKALGWAGTIAERTYQVEARRLSGEHPVHAVDVMVWEQAALEQEEDLARARAEGLDAEMHALRAEIERRSESYEHETRVVSAALDGRIAALRSIAADAARAAREVAGLSGLGGDPFVAER
jgi:eukaryotic-like serine/threonine-protein kinase